MIALADEVFAAQNDPAQLEVDEAVMDRLERIHPATLSDHIVGNGPVVWILLIPTTIDLMNKFIAEEISETELLNQTPIDIEYEALYLCSALVLPEYRRQGLATQVGTAAVESICKDHPIKYLFTWNFSKEGANLSELASETLGLPLLKRPKS
jgi:GNAT superfamily N-acetyltransferase